MGLTSSLLIGQSALAASQLALQVTGNNIANVGSPSFHRQGVNLGPTRGSQVSSSIYVGRGVNVQDVRRAIDPGLQTRLRNSLSDEQSATIDRTVLAQIESILNELSGSDLSSELSKFFNAFSELANNPASSVNRASVVEQGSSLAGFIRRTRSDLLGTRTQIDQQLSTDVKRADGLLNEIATLNLAVVSAEMAGGTDGGLRDQRDSLVSELAGLMDITVIERETGSLDILVGSTPVVLGSQARGIAFDLRTENNTLVASVRVKETNEPLRIDSGAIGARLNQRGATVQQTIDDLDRLASSVIFEVNKLHTSGRPGRPISDVTGWQVVAPVDQGLSFNDPTNGTFSRLPFGPVNGGFDVVVTDANGNRTVTRIEVDLDGIDSTGAAGFSDDMSLSDLVAALNGVSNLSASITANGQLRLTTDAGFDVSFKDDTSGLMAVLGVNTYFQGTNGLDIAIRDDIQADPLKLSVGLGSGTNETALAIAGLRDRSLSSLGGDTIGNSWLKTVERQAVRGTAAETRLLASGTVRSSLEAQYAGVSGVSLDEESINLINYQQSYQGAARFISVVNELTQVLMNLV
ncbi:MAG: flagellar hook-associated protein FlgK [Phycisphaerae bacterium]|nr:flagellar hook-associated protein FlgK [Phycisphaerae bacterium]